MMRNLFACLGLMVCWTGFSAQNTSSETFSGWANAVVATGGDNKLVVLPTVGGRIIYFSLNNDNILYQEPGSGGRTLADAPEGFAVGGYQCELGPVIRSLPDHRPLLLGAFECQTPGNGLIIVRSAPHPVLGVTLEKEILLDPDTGELGVVQKMKNTSNAEVSYCLQDNTQCKPGGFAFCPANKKSKFKNSYSVLRKDEAGKMVWEGDRARDSRIQIKDGIFMVESKGDPIQLGTDTDADWVAYTSGRLVLVKYFPPQPKGRYTDGGNTVAITLGDKFVEFGPVSPEVRLKPGESYAFPEKWVLLDLERSIDTFNELKAVVKRIPKSPFKK